MADPSIGTETANDFVTIVTTVGMGVGAGIAAIVARLGWKSGDKSITKPEELVEIRSAIVDSSAIDRLTASIEAHSMNLIAAKVAAAEITKDFDRVLTAFENMATELRELGREIREAAREASRTKN